MGNSGNLGVLFGHSLRRVDDHQHHVGPLHGSYSTDNAVALQFFFNLALSSEARRIDKHILCAIVHNLRIHSVSGSSRHVGHNYTVLP